MNKYCIKEVKLFILAKENNLSEIKATQNQKFYPCYSNGWRKISDCINILKGDNYCKETNISNENGVLNLLPVL